MSGIIKNIMKLQIDILESDSYIKDQILEALVKGINKKLPPLFNNAKESIKNTVISSLKNQPEYSSLLNGQLKYEFGLPDPQQRLDRILTVLENSMVSSLDKVSISGNSLKGGFKIEFIRSDYSDILPLPESSFVTEKGSKLEWLNWLLLQGDSAIVMGYSFVLGGFRFSRTGGGIMKSNESGLWRVPTQFAGSVDNNWIVRGILGCSDEIQQILNSIIKKLDS